MILNKKSVRFTRHALQRCVDNNIPIKDLLVAWDKSELYKIPIKMERYKFSVYGLESLDDFYMYDYSSQLLFTCHKKGKTTIVITITKKKITYSKK